MKNKKKILIVANEYTTIVDFRMEMLQKLIEVGFSVFVALPYDINCKRIEDIGAKIIDLPMSRRGTNPIKDIKLLISIISVIKRLKPDVVLTYTIKPNVYAGLACQLTRKPYIANITGLGTAIENGGVMQLLTINLYRIGLRKARCVFFQNSNNRKLFKEKKIARKHTRLIPGSGVNTVFHNYEEYPDKSDNLRFLFVGRIMKDKGIEELLSAINKVHNEYPNTSLDIVGGYDEDYTAELEKAITTGYIRYHGMQKDVHSFYKVAHCIVLPSYHEGMANVLLEAASTGRPVIASDIPGCQETFKEGKTGFGCKAKSADSLAIAMERFIKLSYEQKSAMGLAGRKKVKKEFDRNIVVNAYLDEINKIVRK